MNSRVTVPLSDEDYAAVSKMAELTGQSRGRILADHLEYALPMLRRVAAAFRAAEKLEGIERQQFLKAMDQAEAKLMDALSEVEPLLGRMGLKTAADGPAVPQGPRPEASAAGAVRRVPDPPITNRGVHNGG